MATQTIEFGFDSGSTISVVATPVADIGTEYTASSVTEVRGGLYRAAFVDQSLPVGVYRFEAKEGSVVLGRSLVEITATSGTFREKNEAIATIDTAGMASDIVAAINADGVTIKEFSATALAQISARGIVVTSPSISSKRLKVYIGTTHSIAGGTAWTWSDPTGQFPAGGTWRVELFQNDVLAATGDVSLISGDPGETQVYAGEMAATETANMTTQTGAFFVLQQIDGENFLRWYGVAEMVRGKKPT